MNHLETYLRALRETRAAGAVPETSYYPALSALLSEAGKSLKPSVRCVVNPKNKGAGIPDGGFYTPDQYQRAATGPPPPSLLPARGVLEAKGTQDDVARIAQSDQVRRYLGRYGQVLVTNLRDFLLVGADANGMPVVLEQYRLADSETAFWTAPIAAITEQHGASLLDYLRRALLRPAPLATPEDLAWFLASYARDAKHRIEHASLPALDAVRAALEEALGLRFQGEKGDHFFRSTLVQTLFYGIFSAWVLWCKKQSAGAAGRFDWRVAAWELRVPMIRTLFEQVAQPTHLGPLGLVEVLNWTGDALNRVDQSAFFSRFAEDHAVQYFYEPFLQAFDPELRKELGVWYTPPEIVTYMVERVDTVLREELGIPDGLADDRVVVLDPCCGTGAYLVEVLKKIQATLDTNGAGALGGIKLKQAATERVFGFEILPAPFVVAHLQMGLFLQAAGAALSDGTAERAGVFLTNALTGWEPAQGPKQHLLFTEMEEERDRANAVKQSAPILVILGNPPYNSFAGVAVDEERALSMAYRTTKAAPAPQGQGLNDLYVRFFRMAERRIAETSGEGIVCFISNYSWLDGLSHTGMRERFLDAFDDLWIDSLNGDKYKTGKLTPEGDPDPSAFSTESNREGIQVGTAVALFVRQRAHVAARSVHFRNFWGRAKRADLIASVAPDACNEYDDVTPPLTLGLPFTPLLMGEDYGTWPLLTDLFPVLYPGVKTSRDDVVVDIDKERLVRRMEQYFDPAITDDAMTKLIPGAMDSGERFDPYAIRSYLVKRGFLPEHVRKYNYRPFDVRWLYWEPETDLLDRKREDYVPAVFAENLCLVSQQKPRREWSRPQIIRSLGCLDLMDRGASCIPLKLRPKSPDGLFSDNSTPADGDGNPWNLSKRAWEYLAGLEEAGGPLTPNSGGIRLPQNWGPGGSLPDDLFFHALAVLHAPAYAGENAGALRQDWPRIPLPASRDALRESAALGRQVAALLDPETPVPGVTTGAIRPELKSIAVVSKAGGGQLDPGAGDLDVTAGWGHAGQGGVTMPGRGRVVTRPASENTLLGDTTLDVYLNDRAYFANIPSRVWHYSLGGYQVLKKWLSYRERSLLGRALTPEELSEVQATARRIAALLLTETDLDANYAAVKDT